MDDTEEGTYFVDESGNYYYQATKDSEPVLTEPPDGDNIQFIVEEEDDENSIGTADNLDNDIESASTAAAGTTAATRTRKQITTKVEVDDFGNVDGVAFDGNDADGDGEFNDAFPFVVSMPMPISQPNCHFAFSVSYVYIMDEKDGTIGEDGTQDELVDNVVEEKVYV